jgi:hypothetical protein
MKARELDYGLGFELIKQPKDAVHRHAGFLGRSPQSGITCQQRPTTNLRDHEGEGVGRGKLVLASL